MKTRKLQSLSTLAASITKISSLQTYYTIQFLVDRSRVAQAYQAYAYFRWVDDRLDAGSSSAFERSTFIQRQKSLLESCSRGETVAEACLQEQMLVELIRSDPQENSGLRAYLCNMM